MKGHFPFLKTPEKKPHHQMQFCVITWTLVRGRALPHCRGAIGVVPSGRGRVENMQLVMTK